VKKILIIEDEKILFEMYKFKFTKAGFKVFNSIDVDGGLKIAKEEHPDLIILDILLPKESGIKFLEKRNSHEDIVNIPVVVLSNFDDNETRDKAYSLGATSYLIKSNFNPTEILEKLQDIIK
jgi:two-component system alkaline phosphatase synthesis response regulator PhoP